MQNLATTSGQAIGFGSMAQLGEPDPSNITKQDILSSLSFDKIGRYLSVGDRGGRLIVFEQIQEGGQIEMDYLTEFQSHETAFDPLTSSQIPEKINAIEWINPYHSSLPQMLVANDRVIKLWKVEFRRERKFESCKKLLQKGKLAIPRSKVVNEGYEGKLRKQY